ncbi:type II and III secretion system protein family protein [Noviherbaspirillum sedimenti]|uniref:Type II and III secretion system protein family protein n=1 Tax=Noviherbaspirillum sedimenti TaxID=2320865 RepID=A0A3A3GAM0_9BURK|nr:type II and III secretion system protein family protein [Noviherbaspirillum sedimenti]RJG03662.1 type II and III secretion system protein family protein [Noviherbaspirillum sedimenti]
MSTFCIGEKPAVSRMAIAVAGMIVTASLAHGQVAGEAGVLATKNNQANAASKPVKGAAVKPAAVKPADLKIQSPITRSGSSMTGNVELAPQINLSEGKSTLMRLPHPASRMSVGDASIADVILLNPSEVYMLGKSVGSTNLILWNKNNDATIVDISVGIDTVALHGRLAELLASEKDIKITTAADTIILSGTVSDVVKADQVLALANAYVQRSARGAQARGAGAAAPAAGAAPGGAAPAAGGGQANVPKVVNMLSIAAPQQVMLEVKVAEVSKTLVDQLGASIGASKTRGSWTYTLLSNLLSGNPSLVDGFKTNGNFATLDAQKRDGLVKVLAEPTIMAISGQEASFLAGGKIFIPISQTNNGGTPTITLEEKEFGVAVKFTPTVLEGGRINLKVAPEVSDLNKEGVGITATGVSTTAILPSFTTRRATTTVQLYDGQSFAIGGLIKNNVTANIKAFPLLGEVPVLGALFRSSDFQTDRSELVFIITPHLVKPLPPDYKLPTDAYIQPSRAEFFLGGKMEGSAPPEEMMPAQPATGFELK